MTKRTTPPTPTTVAELRAAINAGKVIAAQRLTDHANDEGQSDISRDVCRRLAAKVSAP